jgi:hypothetical protein
VRHLGEQIEHYHGMERTLQNSLLTAERMGEEARERARLEADTILEDARMRAERILEDSRERLRSLKREVRDVHRQKDLFIQRFQSFLENQIQALHSHEDEMRGIDALDARADALIAEATRPAEERVVEKSGPAPEPVAPDPGVPARFRREEAPSTDGLVEEPPRAPRRPRLEPLRPAPRPVSRDDGSLLSTDENRLSFFETESEGDPKR